MAVVMNRGIETPPGADDPRFWDSAHREQVVERTNASTPLLDIGPVLECTLIDKLSLPRSRFPSVVDPG